MLCKAKTERKEHFFTYPLALPEYNEDEVYFHYVPKMKKNWKPFSYGITVSKQIKNE